MDGTREPIGPSRVQGAVEHAALANGEIVDGEVRGEHLEARNFEFEPAKLFEDDPPRMIVLRLVGLNQHDEHGNVDDDGRLADGRYIGFIGAKSEHDTHLAAVVVLTVMAPSLPDLNMT